MENDSIATRLKVFMEKMNLTSTQLADCCSIPRPSFSQIISGRNKKVSDQFLTLIHKGFPNLSMNWLLFGEGDMFDTCDKMPKPVDQDIEVDIDVVNPENNEFPSSHSHPNFEERFPKLKIEHTSSQQSAPPQKPKKISHITVYYDDQTFETFIPKKN